MKSFIKKVSAIVLAGLLILGPLESASSVYANSVKSSLFDEYAEYISYEKLLRYKILGSGNSIGYALRLVEDLASRDVPRRHFKKWIFSSWYGFIDFLIKNYRLSKIGIYIFLIGDYYYIIEFY